MALNSDLSHSDSVPDTLQDRLPSQLLQKIFLGTYSDLTLTWNCQQIILWRECSKFHSEALYKNTKAVDLCALLAGIALLYQNIYLSEKFEKFAKMITKDNVLS